MQMIFNPADFNFTWEGGWYAWDHDAAHKAARKHRDVAAKEAQGRGQKVSKFRLPNQLITRGGIGSGRPHIDLMVTCYGFNAW